MLLKSCCVTLTLIIQLFCDQMSSNFSSSFFNSFCVQRINDLTYFIVIITSLYLYLHHPMITMKSAHGLHQCAVTFLSNLLFSIVLALLYWVRSTFCAHWTELQTAVMQREIHLSKLAVWFGAVCAVMALLWWPSCTIDIWIGFCHPWPRCWVHWLLWLGPLSVNVTKSSHDLLFWTCSILNVFLVKVSQRGVEQSSFFVLAGLTKPKPQSEITGITSGYPLSLLSCVPT